MSKKTEEVAEELHMKSAPAEPEAVIVNVKPPSKMYSIEQWVQLRKKSARHLSGIKAFLGSAANNKYTLDVWDAKMASY